MQNPNTRLIKKDIKRIKREKEKVESAYKKCEFEIIPKLEDIFKDYWDLGDG